MIAHFDLDAFFVSVEILLNPALKGIPLAVGGRSDRSVVAACSYEARKFGIHSAMPMRNALRLCPGLTVVNATRQEYTRYSQMVTDIIADAAPVFEKASIDEFYIDLHGMERYFQPLEWALALREKIMAATGLPLSFGMGSGKMVAKIATDLAKPNGWLLVEPGKENEFLDKLVVGKISGVGAQTSRQLLELGIETIGELRTAPIHLLTRKLGKSGTRLWQKANGLDKGTVTPYQEAKSISSENTFETDITDPLFLEEELVKMTRKLAFELRQKNKMAACISVKIRYPDFETISRQSTIPLSCYDDELIPQAKLLLGQAWKKGAAVRLIGLKISDFSELAGQGNLFRQQHRKSDLYKTIDDISNKFGKNAIGKAGDLKK